MVENIQEVAPAKDRGEIIFWITAFVVLFFGLGHYGLWASEDRWAEIAREMIISKDFFHPAINGKVYFDKPLLSYWFIVAVYYVWGTLNEFVIRVPSALAALGGLFGTVWLGKKLWNREAGLTAGWILLSSYGFLFWGRAAAADMANLAAIILAVAWFYYREEKAGFFSYLLFYLICFLGAMTKGLPALVMPVVAIAPYVIREKRWKKHLKFSNFAAAFLGLGIYAVPFYLASVMPMPEYYLKPTHNLSGLELVWRENILRVFQPFDHNDEPFFCYLYQLPRVMVPWVLFFVSAVVVYIMKWKKLTREERWIAEASILIFLLFSASGSRRWYYILPLMPFCALMTADFLQSVEKAKWEKSIIEIMRWIVIIVASLAVISVILLPFWTRLAGFRPPLAILISAPILGFVALIVMFFDERGDRELLKRFTGMPVQIAGVILGGAILTCGFFSVQWPALDEFRTEKAFILKMKKELAGFLPSDIIIFGKLPPKFIFYMDMKRPVRVVEEPEELKKILEKSTGKIVLVSYNRGRYLRKLSTVLSAKRLEEPDYKEQFMPLEKEKARKLYIWIINSNRGKQ
jgi:4-amino-4-deoxy-L-arabinose transferase-like glycosyltransferase